jgi:AcrR family transcriptional regulator
VPAVSDDVAPDRLLDAAPADPPALERLPRGRHGLSREEVRRSQRERIMTGMATAMTEHGYVGTSVTEILRRASVSRQTFYEQFTSKEDCFAATYSWATQMLMEQIVRARQGPEDGGSDAGEDDPVDRMLGLYLRSLAVAPDFARVLLIETFAAGPAALERRIEMQRQFAELLASVLGATSDQDRFACEVLIGGLSAQVTARLAVGDLDGLRALHGPLATAARRTASTFDADGT